MESRFYRGLVFIIPLLYSIHTRFLRRSNLGIIVWMTEYFMPVMLAMIILDTLNFNLFHALLSVIAVYNLYEIGYIQNDCETIKHERNPTKRHTDDAFLFYERWKCVIYSIRIIVSIILTIYFYNVGLSVVRLVVLWIIIPYYMVYNHLRGRINLYLLLPLTGYRYVFPVCLYGIEQTQFYWIVMLFLFMAYPLPTFFEICADGKGNAPEQWTKIFMPNFEGRFVFRIKYYTFFTIVSAFLYITGFIPFAVVLIPLYYLLDRIPQLKMKKLGNK